MKRLTLSIFIILIGINFSGCSTMGKYIEEYQAKKHKKNICIRKQNNCIVNNLKGRDVTNVHSNLNVTNYCARLIPCN